MFTSIRRISAALFFAAALILGAAGPANAQSYEGSDTDSGVFNAPGGEVAPGSAIGFTATGLDPFAVVNIILVDGAGNPVNTSSDLSIAVSANAEGEITTSIPIPSNLAPGSYTVLVDSAKSAGPDFHAEFPFVIAGAAQPTPEPNPAPDLAFTGASSLTLAVGAALLIVLGGGLLISSKPSRSNEQ